MSAVNLRLATHTSPTFSFQSALLAFSGGYNEPGIELGSSFLFSAGCYVNDNDTSNCTVACQDAGLIFTNPYTMQNCMVLTSLGPSPTGVNLNGSLTPLQNHTFSPQSLTIASKFSIDPTDPGFPSLALSVNKTIAECLQQYCNNDTHCSVGYEESCSWSDVSSFGGTNGRFFGINCYPDICFGYGSSSLNPDIGGIGVWRLFLHVNLIAFTKPE